MNIIEWIKQILVSRESLDSFSDVDKKSFNSFIINRWLSMDEDFIELVKATSGVHKIEILPYENPGKYLKDA